MRSHFIIIASLATASVVLASGQAGKQTVLIVPEQKSSTGAEESKSGYVIDKSKKSTRGYDYDGRQEVVNIGPRMKTTADRQTQSRTGPRGRQRGAILPHKYIVRLKNGADFSSLDLHSKVTEHNRLIRLAPADDGELNEFIPNQVIHEYDFGSWKGYAGQFSSDFLKELESNEEIEYVEEDTLMWAWDMEPQDSTENNPEEHEAQLDVQSDILAPSTGSNLVEKTKVSANATLHSDMNAVLRMEYFSLKAPSWGLTRISQHQRDLRKDYSYMASAGLDVDIYIIDSGVYEDHRDFGGRAFNIANFVPGEEDSDTCGHGTHVAGIAAGHRYGVAKSARVYAVKVLDSEGQGSTSQVLAGINYMIRHASSNPNPRKIINMSLGGQFSRPVNEAVRVAVSKYNLPFFVAAGNTGDDACQYSPAGVEEAFAVGGSDRSDRIGWYSCVGACVNIFAPGTGIVSDWIRSPTSTHILDGTSMAAPHVAGVAALFLGAGNTYDSARELYDDIVRHSTQNVISGIQSGDSRTTRNLLYNKFEDTLDVNSVVPQDK
ncbi:subtilisin-like serine protease [Entomortierella beljakovae]|nr:subtilisin-like serine protease [Entomortierella beljakovae]